MVRDKRGKGEVAGCGRVADPLPLAPGVSIITASDKRVRGAGDEDDVDGEGMAVPRGTGGAMYTLATFMASERAFWKSVFGGAGRPPEWNRSVMKTWTV